MNKRPGFRKRIALELFRSLKRSRAKLHELQTLYWECTLRCNQACRHCGQDCHTSPGRKDMPLADFLQAIDTITPHVNPAKVLVKLTGGEPLLRDDLEQCGSELQRRGYPWAIATNGTCLSRKRLDALLAAGLKSATVCLDGFEQAHNWLHRDPESFDRAIDAVCMLEERKEVECTVVTCVNQRNFTDLPMFKKYLEEVGVRRWQLTTATASPQSPPEQDLLLSNGQFTALLNFIRQCRSGQGLRAGYSCEGFLGNYEAEVRDQLFHCTSGINKASILADGSICGCPCIHSGFREGNIYTDPFAEVWQHRFKPYRDREWARNGECQECSLFRYCEGSGMHLRGSNGRLQTCHYKRII